MIANVYVGITCIFPLFVNSSICVGNIQHSMLDFHKETTVFLENKGQLIITKTMLSSLVIHNSFESDAYMDNIDEMKFQLRHLHLGEYFILFKNIKVSDIYISITVFLL